MDNSITGYIEAAIANRLTVLNLSGRDIDELPSDIGDATQLTHLILRDNRLTSLPSAIGRLVKLEVLVASNNHLTTIPNEIAGLTSLKKLDLSHNDFTSFPDSLCRLDQLESIRIRDNRIHDVPHEFAHLPRLRSVDISRNDFLRLPAAVLMPPLLEELIADDNHIVELSEAVGQCKTLSVLSLKGNAITDLPKELSDCKELDTLDIQGNPLKTPPPEVLSRGLTVIKEYLSELPDSEQRWVSKLLVVGQGGVGKTCAIRYLKYNEFDDSQPTTHGIVVDTLHVKHPDHSLIDMTLNVWDFGGQEIYHATHQFFLTNRSLFLLMWNARIGYDESRVQYWLDIIQARAPESPIILVATHIDERLADIPFRHLKMKYPRLEAHLSISSKSGEGIEELRSTLGAVASRLPLMGELWPRSWLRALAKLRERRRDRHIYPAEFGHVLLKNGVEIQKHSVVGQIFHDLGEILYWEREHILSSTVIVDPQWVSSQVSLVLDDKTVAESGGILSNTDVERIWADASAALQAFFVRLMEKFDLSYRTEENGLQSLVVERLPFEPPPYEIPWEAKRSIPNTQHVQIKYVLNTLPPGIPTWFIARNHRFSVNKHWRRGALFQSHDGMTLALIEADQHTNTVILQALGMFPGDFFALLKDGFEWTLGRYPGLKVQRYVPCPGHNGTPCTGEFNLSSLMNRLRRQPPVTSVECAASASAAKVSIPRLLFGWHADMSSTVLQALTVAVEELREEEKRRYDIVRLRERSKVKMECPSLLVVRPSTSLLEIFGINRKHVHLCCEAPGQSHPIESAPYKVKETPQLWRTWAPFLKRTLQVLKVATPFVGPGAGIFSEEAAKRLGGELKLLERVVKTLPAPEDGYYNMEKDTQRSASGEEGRFVNLRGAALREFRAFLKRVDPLDRFQGLELVLTPEGYWLWLCSEHAREYKM